MKIFYSLLNKLVVKMKIIFALSIALFIVSNFAQTTTYSKEEEKMLQYVNMGRAYAMKYDSPEKVIPVIDSCWNFLEQYPNSFAKHGVFAYLLEMTAMVSTDLTEIDPLIDSVLYYDKLPTTKQRIGELLIERDLDFQRGREYIFEALPNLTVPYHFYKSYLLLAKTDIRLGKYVSAEMNLKKAISIDSTRSEALYEYVNLLSMREVPERSDEIKERINELNEQSKLRYVNQTNISPNINKSVLSLSFIDLDSNSVDLNFWEGKVVIINRFNFWCKICTWEFPTLQRLMEKYPEVEFIFINSGESPEELKNLYYSQKEFSFLKDQKVLFVKRDYYDKIYTRGVPHTFVVDKKGNIRLDYGGYRKELENILIDKINELLKE